MLKFLNLQPDTFGVDINDLSLRLVKLEKKRGRVNLVSFNQMKIRPGVVKEGVIQDKEALTKIIKFAAETAHGKKLNTKYVVVSLPEEKSFSQVIRMPEMTEEELKLAVPFEAENYIPLPIDEVYLDFQVIKLNENDSNHIHLLINVMPKSIIDSYVECFKKAGLIPCILEIESQAIVRTLLKKEESFLPVIFIDFGETKTSFIIFSGNSIRFTSTIPISSKQLTDKIAEDLKISQEKAEELKRKYGLTKNTDKKYDIKGAIEPILDELVLQIKKYIGFYQGHVSHNYFSTNGKIQKIVLCGGGANLKLFPEFLSRELKIGVEIGDPLANVVKQKYYIIQKQKALSFTTAIGLALRGIQEENI